MIDVDMTIVLSATTEPPCRSGSELSAAACISVRMELSPLQPWAGPWVSVKSLSEAATDGDDLVSAIKVSIHGISIPRPVRSIPASEKEGDSRMAEGGLPSFGSHGAAKVPGPLQGCGLCVVGAQSAAPFTRPQRLSLATTILQSPFATSTIRQSGSWVSAEAGLGQSSAVPT